MLTTILFCCSLAGTGWSSEEGVGALMLIGASFLMGMMFVFFAWAGMSEEASVLEVLPWGYRYEIKQKIYDDGDGQKEFAGTFIGAQYGTNVTNMDEDEYKSGDVFDLETLSGGLLGGCGDMNLGSVLGWQLFFALSMIIFGCCGSCCADEFEDNEGIGNAISCILPCSVLGLLASTIAAVAVFDQECYPDLVDAVAAGYGDEYEDVGNLYKVYAGHGIAFKLEALALTLFFISFAITCCGRLCGLSVDESFA